MKPFRRPVFGQKPDRGNLVAEFVRPTVEFDDQAPSFVLPLIFRLFFEMDNGRILWTCWRVKTPTFFGQKPPDLSSRRHDLIIPSSANNSAASFGSPGEFAACIWRKCK